MDGARNEFGAVYEELKAPSDNKDYREEEYDAKAPSEIGLEDSSDIDEGGTIDRVKTEFIYALNEVRWKRIRGNALLCSFSRLDRHEIVDRFREYETSRILETRLLIKDEYLAIADKCKWGNGYSKREINKKNAIVPFLKREKSASGAGTKPVFLMSPFLRPVFNARNNRVRYLVIDEVVR